MPRKPSPAIAVVGAGFCVYRCAIGHEFDDHPGLTECPAFLGIGPRRRQCRAPLTAAPPPPDPLAGLDLPGPLMSRVEFNVWGESSSPYECGPLHVTISPDGFELRWLGAGGPPDWKGDWTELRLSLKAVEDWRKQEENEKRVRRRQLREAREAVKGNAMGLRRREQIARNIASIRLIRDDEGCDG